MHATLPAMPTDRSVPGDGATLHARDWGGEASAQPVVLLHGLSSNARIWDGVASRLAAAGLRPVAIDQRGHGESEQPSSGYDFSTVTSDLDRALDALEIRRPLLTGHSWGGNVSLQYTVQHPGGDGIARARFHFDNHTERRNERYYSAQNPRSRTDGIRERAVVVAFVPSLRQVVDALYDQRPSRLLPEVTCPLLRCPAGGQGGAAKRAAVERAQRLRPDARVSWFEDSMHDIPLQHPAELADTLIGFAAEVADRG